MENHKPVLPGYLTQFGFLFGGNLLEWVDEYAWIAVSLDFPTCNLAPLTWTGRLKKSVREGTILKIIAHKTAAASVRSEACTSRPLCWSG